MSYAGAFTLNPIITIIGATGMFLSAAYLAQFFLRAFILVTILLSSSYMLGLPKPLSTY